MRLIFKFRNDRELEKSVNKALQEEFAKHFNKMASGIQKEVSDFLLFKFKTTEEYNSLIGNDTSGIDLMAELGLVQSEASSIVDHILSVLVNEIKVKHNKDGLSIYLDESVIDKLYNVPGASYVSFSKEGSTDIPWLKWMLEGGIQVKHHIVHGNFSHPSANSRSKRAVMKPGGSWHMPTKYAGSKEDNWITRTFESIGLEIDAVIAKAIIKYV